MLIKIPYMIRTNKTLADNLLDKELRKHKPLTNEQNQQLLQQYSETKSDVLRTKIYNGNLRLIVMKMNEFAGLYDLSKAEMFSIGSLGLLRAIQYYDINAGYAFSSYAATTIINTFSDEAKMNESLIRKKKTDREKIKSGEITEYKYSSIDTPINEDGLTIGDMLQTHGSLFDEQIDEVNDIDKERIFWNHIRSLIKKDKHYDILKAVFSANTETGTPIKLTETLIGEIYGVSKQNIGQTKHSLYKKLSKDPQIKKWYDQNFMNY